MYRARRDPDHHLRRAEHWLGNIPEGKNLSRIARKVENDGPHAFNKQADTVRPAAFQKGPNLIATAKNMKIRQTRTVMACRGRVQRNHFG